MGRYESNDPADRFEDDYEDRPQPRQSKPRVRIKTEAPRPIKIEAKQFPQRKATKKNRSGEMYEANENGMHAREFVKRMALDHPTLQTRDMMPLIEKAGYSISIVAVSNYRTEFMHSLSLLKTLGWRQPKPKP
jgi:hypothetical protein